MKLCHICNSAPHYRDSIFRLIDETFDCDCLFGDSMGDIKQMETSTLRGNVTIVENKRLGKWYWQPKVLGLLRKSYDTYLILGDTRCLSTWIFSICARLFYPTKRIFFWSHCWYGKETKAEKHIKKIFFHLPKGGIFLYGNYAKELMIKEGFNPEKLYVIHSSLAYDKQLELRRTMSVKPIFTERFMNFDNNLIFIGRLTKVKQLDILLKAIKLLSDRGKFFNLTFVGDGSEREKLESLVKGLGLTERVWFYGACYDETVNADFIYNADLCVSPGNVGLTAMHVMMFGTPVVTHNNFAYQMPEFEAIHEGETGAFFEYGNVESLAQTIADWFSSKFDKREEVRKACFREIDTQWTPQFQINVLKTFL